MRVYIIQKIFKIILGLKFSFVARDAISLLSQARLLFHITFVVFRLFVYNLFTNLRNKKGNTRYVHKFKYSLLKNENINL